MSLLWQRSSYGWQAPGGSSTQTLRSTFRGSAFYETDRAAREGNTGPTMVPAIIGIPSAGAVGDQQFRFRQLDSAGTPTGPDTTSLYPALAGFADNVIDLPAGILTGSDVASEFETIASGIYATVSRTDAAVDITDDITAGSAFLSSSNSGGGGIVGSTDQIGNNDFAQPDANVCSFSTPAFGSTAYVWAIELRIASIYVERLRIGIYAGGAIGAPVGSTLLYDFGQTRVVESVDGYLTLYCQSLVELPPSTLIQVVVQGDVGTTTEVNYMSSAQAGDFNVGGSGGIFNVNAAIGTNPAVALPDPFPAGGSLTSNAFVFNARLIYRLDPLFGNGQLATRYGVNVGVADLPNRAAFSANVFTGGNLPPQLEGLDLDYVDIACEDDASFRMAAYQGGIIEDPDTASLLHDFGRGPSGPGLPTAYYRLDVPPDTSAPIDRTLPVWAVARNNGVANIAFVFRNNNPGPGSASPDDDPMQWPLNDSAPAAGDRPEYETFATNPNFSIDPDDAYEATFQSDATDNLPGNIPGVALGFRIDPVELEVVP